MRRRSIRLALGTMVLVLTPIVGGVGSVARADDTATSAEISRGATGSAGLATNAGASCNGAAVPVRPRPPSLTAAQLASLQTVQRWADLIASAQPDDSDPALFAELTTVFPGTDIHSPEELSAGWGNLQAADVVWVREDGSGALVFGELVYDSASSKPCRTGFLCGRAEVDRGVIDSLALEAADGAIDEGTVVTSRYPYVEGRWIAADDATSSGATVQARLVDLCNAGVPARRRVAAGGGLHRPGDGGRGELGRRGGVPGAAERIASSGPRRRCTGHDPRRILGRGDRHRNGVIDHVRATDRRDDASGPAAVDMHLRHHRHGVEHTRVDHGTSRRAGAVGTHQPRRQRRLQRVGTGRHGWNGDSARSRHDRRRHDRRRRRPPSTRPPSTRPPSTRPPTTRTRPSGRSASTPRPPRSPTHRESAGDRRCCRCRVSGRRRASIDRRPRSRQQRTPASRCRRGP